MTTTFQDVHVDDVETTTGIYITPEGERRSISGGRIHRDTPVNAPLEAAEPSIDAQRHQAAAEARMNMQRAERAAELQAESDAFQALTSTEQKIYVEKKYKPEIKHLQEMHRVACDAVEDFTDSEITFKTNVAVDYATKCKHPEVRVIYCMGHTHRQHLLQSGEITKGGYHQIEERLNPLRLICVPVAVNSLQHYATSPEAQKVAQFEFDTAKKVLVKARDRASVALVEKQIEAQKLWDSIEEMPSFFTKTKQPKSK